jgi:hypothetical protein
MSEHTWRKIKAEKPSQTLKFSNEMKRSTMPNNFNCITTHITISS